MSTFAERFAAKIQRGEGCWTWLGHRDAGGYGRVMRSGVNQLAHRVAWELENGPLRRGQHVMHRCDNPPCVRVDHLSVGTHADNMRDCVAKGRRRGPANRGAMNPMSKLSQEDVRQIRCLVALSIPQSWIASLYGVSQSNVSRLKGGGWS